MKIHDLNIGYVPYSLDLSSPGDRRRFPYFAKRHKLQFEIAELHKEYDIILLTALSNLSIWLEYKKKHPQTRFIFEMVDSLILNADVLRNLFKGPGRFILGKEKYFYFNYKTPIVNWIIEADAVICSSEDLKKIISKLNEHVHISLDYLEGEINSLKTNYEVKGKLKLVWEGQAVVLQHLLKYKKMFRKISNECELHIITDERIPKFGSLFHSNTTDLLCQLPIDTFFHKWELYKNYKDLLEFDCSIIPLDKRHTLAWHKPANKLISFWFCGMPTLTSDTPAYKLIMKEVGTDWSCNSEKEWIEKIMAIRNMTIEERRNTAEKNLAFVKKYFSDEALDKVWIEIFEKTASL